MSHTSRYRHAGHDGKVREFTFIHNGDFSGHATIVELGRAGAPDMELCQLPCDVLLDFAGDAVRSRRIDELEGATGRDVIGLGGA